MTKELFRDDSYLKDCTTQVTEITESGGIVCAETVFYPQGGGQAGDQGTLHFADQEITINTTVKDKETGLLVHVPAEDSPLPPVGAEVTLNLDWTHRYPLMQMHTALHLLCAIIPHGVTGGQIGMAKSRLDFDISTSDQPLPDKASIQEALENLIAENHAISLHWVDDALLQQKPEMVRTMSVKPPTNSSGLLRLVQIGAEDNPIDLQPCGGTHVASTAEIGTIRVGKIENKGARNRRVNLHLE